MAEPARTTALSYADYLELERSTDVRHEFLRGEAWAMAGGTPRHSRLKTILTRLFDTATTGSPCNTFDSDLKIRVEETGLATYPDLAVVCGPLQRHPEDRNAVTNPSVMVEVLSPSSEAWDRGGKFLHSQRIPALRHYLLVSQDEPRIEHYERGQDGSWRYSVVEAGGTLTLRDPAVTIDIDGLFADLPEDPPDADAVD